jgi:predicted ArsR family transcriptional regulator
MSELVVARALSDELSWKILKLLTGKELTAREIESALGASAVTTKATLQNLCDAEIIAARGTTLRGRKENKYRLTGLPKAVGFPPRNYFYLSEAVINSLRGSLGENGARMVLRDMGIRMGEGVAQTFASKVKQVEWTPRTYASEFVDGFLAEMGFEPKVVKVDKDRLIYQEHNCLFEDLAKKYPGIVCDVLDEAVHEGVDKLADTKTTRLKCKGHGDPFCQYSVTWQKRGRTKKTRRNSDSSK